eukprot:gene807-419_t
MMRLIGLAVLLFAKNGFGLLSSSIPPFINKASPSTEGSSKGSRKFNSLSSRKLNSLKKIFNFSSKSKFAKVVRVLPRALSRRSLVSTGVSSDTIQLLRTYLNEVASEENDEGEENDKVVQSLKPLIENMSDEFDKRIKSTDGQYITASWFYNFLTTWLATAQSINKRVFEELCVGSVRENNRSKEAQESQGRQVLSDVSEDFFEQQEAACERVRRLKNLSMLLNAVLTKLFHAPVESPSSLKKTISKNGKKIKSKRVGSKRVSESEPEYLNYEDVKKKMNLNLILSLEVWENFDGGRYKSTMTQDKLNNFQL